MFYIYPMRVLITGATGLIGSEIVRLCQSQKIAVNYLTTSKAKIASKEDYKGFYWNPERGVIDSKCFNGITGIINLAGASISNRWTDRYKEIIRSSRVNTLRTLHTALLKHRTAQPENFNNITSFVSASAIGIYPNSLSNYYTEEETEVDDSFLGEVVRLWEREADAFKEFNFSVAKVRIGLVMSSNGGALPELAKPIKAYVGAAFGSGQQWQSWVHITDLARIFLFVLDHKLSGIYNGVGPNPITNNKLVKQIAKVLNKPLWLPNIPKFAMSTLLGEMSYILFASQRVSCKKIEEAGFAFNHMNVCMALDKIYKSSPDRDQAKNNYAKEFSS